MIETTPGPDGTHFELDMKLTAWLVRKDGSRLVIRSVLDHVNSGKGGREDIEDAYMSTATISTVKIPEGVNTNKPSSRMIGC